MLIYITFKVNIWLQVLNLKQYSLHYKDTGKVTYNVTFLVKTLLMINKVFITNVIYQQITSKIKVF